MIVTINYIVVDIKILLTFFLSEFIIYKLNFN